MWQFWPQDQFWLGLRWRGTLSEVSRVIFYFIFGLGGPKLLQLQNLGGGFVVFFSLRGQNRNFVKVRGRKLLLNQKSNIYRVWSLTKLCAIEVWWWSLQNDITFFSISPYRWRVATINVNGPWSRKHYIGTSDEIRRLYMDLNKLHELVCFVILFCSDDFHFLFKI